MNKNKPPTNAQVVRALRERIRELQAEQRQAHNTYQAEIDAVAAVIPMFKRSYTPRATDQFSVKRIIRFANTWKTTDQISRALKLSHNTVNTLVTKAVA